MKNRLVSSAFLLTLVVSTCNSASGQKLEIAYVIRDSDYLNFVYAVGLADDFEMGVVQRTKLALVRQHVEGGLRGLLDSRFSARKTGEQYLAGDQVGRCVPADVLWPGTEGDGRRG